jgi:hypothetical protein
MQRGLQLIKLVSRNPGALIQRQSGGYRPTTPPQDARLACIQAESFVPGNRRASGSSQRHRRPSAEPARSASSSTFHGPATNTAANWLARFSTRALTACGGIRRRLLQPDSFLREPLCAPAHRSSRSAAFMVQSLPWGYAPGRQIATVLADALCQLGEKPPPHAQCSAEISPGQRSGP